MTEILPTVTIVTDNGPCTINKADFVEGTHKVYVEKAASKKTAKKTDADVVGEELVAKDGDKFFIVDSEGKRVKRKGVATKGYDDEAAAWNAIAPAAK